MALKINSQKSWIFCCFLNFLIASIMGLIMRFSYIYPLNINYGYLLHAHSHIAMLGWAYLVIYVLVVCFFIPKDKIEKPIYNQLFWCTEVTVVGMMVSFPFQGYALFSIIFSTAHILLSYIFCWLVWKDSCIAKTGCQKLVLTAVVFMIFSTFGIWCLGPAVSTLGKQSNFYQIAIQFFLHFQFNGWFLIAVLALFLRQFRNEINIKHLEIFENLLVISALLTFAFPLSRYLDSEIIKLINALGVLLQLLAYLYFYKIIKPEIKFFKDNLNSITKIVYGLALSSLFLKISIQLLVLIPDIAETSHQVRNFVIGFIHLTSLGILTGFLFGILLQNKILPNQSHWLRLGMKFFILGYLATEVLLFLQGIFFYFGKGKLPGYYESIFIMSFSIVSGLMLIVTSIIKKTRVN